MNLINVEIDDIDGSDYPDFCDAFINYAEHEDGTPLTDEELENIDSGTVYEYVIDAIY